MKTLETATQLIDAEFYTSLQEDIIQPLVAQGAEFMGLGSLANPGEETGVHVLIFKEPSLPQKVTLYPGYADEGTKSSYIKYGKTLYYIIPMAY